MMLLGAASGAGCSVLTDFTGLTGSTPEPAIEAGVDAGSEAGQADSATDGEAESAAPDSGADASPVDAGAWAFVASTTKNVAMGPITLSAASIVRAGDLVVIGCDSSDSSMGITFSGFSAAVLPTTVTAVATGPSYEAVVAWGIAKQQIDNLTVTATAAVGGQFLDLSINTYRGGSVATLVDHFVTTGSGPGLVGCGPISTASGGVTYYIAART
ncbi:MAG: hypothetical protein ABIP39_09260, partial [Polyangiaceae bacterium]